MPLTATVLLRCILLTGILGLTTPMAGARPAENGQEPADGSADEPAGGSADDPAGGSADDPAGGSASEPADGSARRPADEPAATSSSVRASVLYGSVEDTRLAPDAGGRYRSVPLATGLSAVLPGAGQAYNRQWIKAGIGIAVEAALIFGYVTWRNDGLDRERAFKAQAHHEWDPAQYADWINDYSTFLEQQHGASFTFSEIDIPASVDFSEPDSWSESDRTEVNRLFRDIRSAESELFHPETGASFSHQLPLFGDQQYYELIGKYFQFAPGWMDYPAWEDEEGFTEAIDPERTGTDGKKINVSPTFFQYARDHARSQDLLRRASHVTSLIVVNHVIAAVDAAVFSKLHNDRLHASVSMDYSASGTLEPTARLTVRL